MDSLPVPDIYTGIINTKTIVGTVTADTLRSGAEKINTNFTNLFTHVQDLQDYLCAVNNVICSDNLKLYISPFLTDFEQQYIPREGHVICFNGNGKYGPALAEFSDRQEALGVIYSVMGSRVLIALEGYICNLTELIPGKQYYLSSTDEGRVVTIDELDRCDIAKPIFVAISDTEAIVNIKRGQIKGDLGIDLSSIFIEFNDINTESVIGAIFTPIVLSRIIRYNDINVEASIERVYSFPLLPKIQDSVFYNDINVEASIERVYSFPPLPKIQDSVFYNDINVEASIERVYSAPANLPDVSNSIFYSDVGIEVVINRD